MTVKEMKYGRAIHEPQSLGVPLGGAGSHPMVSSAIVSSIMPDQPSPVSTWEEQWRGVVR